MRVLLADGHPKVRWALRTFIQEELGFTIVGEAPDADALLSQAPSLRPDLILLEWELSGQPAGGILAALRTLDLQAQVIVLSLQPGSEEAALEAGADAFVSKANATESLLIALRRLMSNQSP